MRKLPSRRVVLNAMLVAALWAAPTLAFGQVQIINVIPRNQSNETAQNSETSIAVNPNNTDQRVVSAFDLSQNFSAKYYGTNNGGASYAQIDSKFSADTTLAWSNSGTAYEARLISPSGVNQVVVEKANNPIATGFNVAVPAATYSGNPGGGGIDQPAIFAKQMGGADHIFIGLNDDNPNSGNTATVRYSTNGGGAFQNAVLDDKNPAQGDGPAVRVGIANDGHTVYAAYERFNSRTNAGNPTDFNGDIVITRDDNGGANNFTNLKTGVNNGVNIATNVVIPFDKTTVGNERLGSDVSIAVDPNNANKVFVAYDKTVGGKGQVVVAESTDAGRTFTTVFSSAAANSTGLPYLAVTSTGVVGLLVLENVGANLETHLFQSGDNFATSTDTILSQFPDGTPGVSFQPYVGDYFGLTAVGDTLYGSFAASNDPSLAIWKSPALNVTFQREVVGGNLGDAGAKLGNGSGVANVAISIDPYAFSIQTRVVPEPGSLAMLALGGGLLLQYHRRRRQAA
jgi:PEP-CTERM motif